MRIGPYIGQLRRWDNPKIGIGQDFARQLQTDRCNVGPRVYDPPGGAYMTCHIDPSRASHGADDIGTTKQIAAAGQRKLAQTVGPNEVLQLPPMHLQIDAWPRLSRRPGGQSRRGL